MTAAATVTSSFVDAGGVRTHYLESGSGAPVVLLHGSGPGVTAAANWAHTIPVVAEQYRVLAPELIGFGDSDRAAADGYGISAWVAHVVGFLDALGIARANLVGNSLGGIVSVFTALQHPERVERMVLMGSPGIGMRLTDGLRALRAYEPSLDAMRELLRTYFTNDPDIATDELIELRYEASARPGEADNYRAIHAAQAARTGPRLTPEAVQTIQTPTLLVHGRDDQVLPAEVSWTMLGLLPNADLHVFHHCGHWVQLERADEFCLLVRDFFARPTHRRA
jgi:2-hydroxymuconate-semialdehyde hydrolase/2-hydroxy-6-oxo-octa-2,4-dienoate hydrolase